MRAQEHRRRSTAIIIRTTQLTEPAPEIPEMRNVQLQRPPSRIRRIRIRSRSGNDFNMSSHPAANRTPPEQVTVLTGGVTVLIEGLDQRVGGKPVGTIELSADRMVIWSRGEFAGSAGREEGTVQSEDEPFDVYMEGNVVIFQGDPTNPPLMRRVRAESATFDAREKKGLILKAEIEAYLPSLKGSVRIAADRIRQLGPNEFHAQQAWISPSPYGKPGYRIQATDAFLEQRFRDATFGSESPTVDPATGEQQEETQNWITSLNNVFYIEDVPVVLSPLSQCTGRQVTVSSRKCDVRRRQNLWRSDPHAMGSGEDLRLHQAARCAVDAAGRLSQRSGTGDRHQREVPRQRFVRHSRQVQRHGLGLFHLRSRYRRPRLGPHGPCSPD